MQQQDSDSSKQNAPDKNTKKNPINFWSLLQSIPLTVQTNWQLIQNWIISTHFFQNYWNVSGNREVTQFWRLVLFILSIVTSIGGFGLAFYIWYQKLFQQHVFQTHQQQWFHKHQQTQLSLREKIDQLHHCYNELSLQIDINKEAIEHNAKMQQYQQELDKKLAVRKEKIDSLEKERTTLQEQLQQCRSKIEKLEESSDSMKQTLESLHQEKNEQIHKNETLKQELLHVDAQLQAKQKELEALQMEWKKAEQTRKVFEYVMTKFSPDLALKVQKAIEMERQHQLEAISTPSIESIESSAIPNPSLPSLMLEQQPQ